MAFEGNLRDIEFGDIVQTLSMTRQRGTLVIQGVEERRVAFTERGMALLSARRSHGERVGRYLVGTDRVTKEAFDAAKRLTRRESAAAIGDALLAANAVDPEDLAEARRYVAQDDLYALFRLRQGRFDFRNDELELSGPFASLWFDVGGVAMEAARRIDETPRLDECVPPNDVLAPGDTSLAPRPESSTKAALKLYALADGAHTVAEIVDEYHLGAFDTRKALAALVESGALRSARADEISVAAETVSDPARAARLLRRVVDLTPHSSDGWQRLAKALAASGDKSAAALALCQLSELQYADGRGEEALSTLRTALKLQRQCPEAHARLTRLLFTLELVDEALKAAHEAVDECLAAEAPQVALGIAQAALEHAPDDLHLARGRAAAMAALGDTAGAVSVLDQIAHGLGRQRHREKEQIEVLRSIVALAPERSDIQELLETVIRKAAARKRRKRQLLVAGAAALLLGSLALPTLLADDVREQLDHLNVLIESGRETEAQALIAELQAADIQDPTLQKAMSRLRQRSADAARPPLEPAVPARLNSRIDHIYEQSRAALAERRVLDGLTTLSGVIEELDSEDFRTVRAARPDDALRLVGDFDSEVTSALTEAEATCVDLGIWATGARNDLQNSDALQRAEFTIEETDLEELQRLADLAAQVRSRSTETDWSRIAPEARRLAEATKTKPLAMVTRLETAVGLLTESLTAAREIGQRAVAHLHRVRLRTEFFESRNRGQELVAEGRVEEAAALYRSYLDFCAEVRESDQGEAYARIIGSYMETFQLEELLRDQLDDLESILARERTANDALLKGEVSTAFEMRVGLVREFPVVGFGSRFALPLRITSRPPGAAILLRGADGDTELGRTTSIIEYPAVGDSTIVVRMDGFEEVVLERRGAFDDADGDEVLELTKVPRWRSQPGAATEAAPVTWRDRLFVADRDGVVRALALRDGRELGRLETGLLGGFASTPALHADRLFVAGVDGVGFVVDPESLEILRRFDLEGAVRTSLVATDAGVVLIDERGTIHLVDAEGKPVWAQKMDRVSVDPVAAGERLLVVTHGGQLVVLDLVDGSERRRTAIPGQPRWSAPTLAGGLALVASEGGVLAALDYQRGLVAWTVDVEPRLTGRPTEVGGVVAVPASDGSLLLHAHRDAPERTIATELGPIGDAVAAVGPGFVAAGRTGIVRRIDRKGELEWRYDAGDAIGARPVRGDGCVLIVTRAGQVIALDD